jgi:hypothetical protein
MINDNSDSDSDSQGVRTQRRNLQHGEDDMRLVFGVMISFCCEGGQDMSWQRARYQIKRNPEDLSWSAYRKYGWIWIESLIPTVTGPNRGSPREAMWAAKVLS